MADYGTVITKFAVYSTRQAV